jgi:tripartite-type tricarboxylate transporter receptor subunit TctC
MGGRADRLPAAGIIRIIGTPPMKRRDPMKRIGIALALLACLMPPAAAQDWPTARPVRIIAPSTPGGAADLFARLLAEHFPNVLGGGRFVVENRAGGAGLVGTAATAHAAPDGYTFGISGIAYHAIAPAMALKPGFDPLKDFTHIAYIGGPPNVFIVNPSLGIRSLKDLVAHAHKVGTLDYVAPGVGTLGHLMMEGFARRTGIKIQQIMTSGAAQGMMDLLAGHVQVGTVTWSSALGQIRAGKVIPIALSAATRLADAPDVPTFKELGYEDLTATAWFAFSGPANLPAGLPQRLNTAVRDVLALPPVRKRLESESIDAQTMTIDAFTRFVADEIARWGPLANEIRAKR